MTQLQWILKYALTTSYVLLLLAGCGGSGDDDEGTDVSSNDPCAQVGLKVANGDQCEVGSNPNASPIVAIRVIGITGGVGTCTGTAVSQREIITAAHCFEGLVAGVVVQTYAGVFDTGVVYAVHPDYVTESATRAAQNDIAIVQVPIPLGIQTSPLLVSRVPVVGEDAIIAGLGETSAGSGSSDNVVAGTAQISGVSSDFVVINYTGDQAHPCGGDSGGPIYVFQSGALAIAGVVSQSDPSVPAELICRPGDMTLYTNIQKPTVFNFLRQNIDGLSGL